MAVAPWYQVHSSVWPLPALAAEQGRFRAAPLRVRRRGGMAGYVPGMYGMGKYGAAPNPQPASPTQQRRTAGQWFSDFASTVGDLTDAGHQVLDLRDRAANPSAPGGSITVTAAPTESAGPSPLVLGAVGVAAAGLLYWIASS